MESSCASASTVAQGTQQCLREMEERHRQKNMLSTLFLIIGRTGTGKSSLLEDLTGSEGHSQQAVDSVTQNCEIAKATLGDGKEYFIMDTPGFAGPNQEQDTFLEIIRGIQAVRMLARVAGILYVTCINQTRFEPFDCKLLQLIHALCGGAYLPRLTFVTTFWTASGEGQRATFNDQLQMLQHKWGEELGGEQYKSYQHGRHLNWYEEEDRRRIAQHAQDMIVRHYSEHVTWPMDCQPTPIILQELGTGVPVRDTNAGKLISWSLSGSNTANAGDSRPRSSDRREEQPTAQANPRMKSNQRGQEPEQPSSTGLWDGICKLIGSMNLSVTVGGSPTGGLDFGMGRTYSGPLDPLSSVDVMKSRGLDSSFDGRRRYAANHGISGTPGSASWNNAIRSHVLRDQRR